MKAGFCLLLFAAAAFSQTQDPNAQAQVDVGPTILSPTDMQVPVQIAQETTGGNSFDYFLFTDGFFNTGVPIYKSTANSSGYSNSAGFDGGGGLDLHHRFRRGSISVSYSGAWHQYTNSGFYSGFQQGLNASFKYALTKRFLLSLGQSISTSPNGLGSYQLAQNPFVGANGNAGQTRAFVTNGTLTYQATNRLSYVFGGSFYASQYPSYSTGNSLGGQGSAGLNYRTSKKTTLGFSYLFAHYSYSLNNDSTNSQTGFVSLAHEITARTQFTLAGGVTSAAVTQEILLGVPPNQLLGIYKSTSVFPYFSGTLSHTARHANFALLASQNALAGNGTFNTSKAITVSASASYSPSERWAISGSGGYQHLSSLSSVQQTSNSYGSGFGGAGFNYKLTRHFGLKASAGFGIYDYYGNTSTHPQTSLSFGIVYTSGDRPIVLY
jgi:hypothetical protein